MLALSFRDGAAVAKALVSHDPISTTVMFSFRRHELFVQGMHPTNRETYCLCVFDADMPFEAQGDNEEFHEGFHEGFHDGFQESLHDGLREGPHAVKPRNLDLVVLQNSNALELKDCWKNKETRLLVEGAAHRGVRLTFSNGRVVWFQPPPSSCVPCTFFDPQKVFKQLWHNTRSQGAVSVHMPSAEFQHIIKEFAIVGTLLEVSFDPFLNHIVFRSSGENCEAELKCQGGAFPALHIDAGQVSAPFTCKFTINHIKMTAKGICNSERVIVLTLAKSAPLMLNHGSSEENNLFILFAQAR